jgi:hypothetical protein
MDSTHRFTNSPQELDEFNEWKMDIAVDSEDNIAIVGQSNSIDFPTTIGVEQEEKSGKQDVVIGKFDSAGQLLWSTFLGGQDTDWGDSICVDHLDNIYVSGTTYSSNFPVTSNAYQSSYSGKGDLFLSKLGSTGRIIWNTYIGGSEKEYISALAIDSQNNVYITSSSSSADFPTSSGSYQENHNGRIDRTITKFDSLGELIWSTFYGGSDNDYGVNSIDKSIGFLSIAIDQYDNVIVGSDVVSTNFPVTTQVKYENYMGALSIFTSSGEMKWSSFLVGQIWTIAIDNGNSIIIGGKGRAYYFSSFNSFLYGFVEISIGSYLSETNRIEEFLYKFLNNGTLEWSTRVVAIVHPENDWDDDTLTNYDEYQRCFETSFMECTDPLNADTDGDGLDDNIEIDMGINPALRDTDGDGWNDGIEVRLGIKPDSVDSDNDGMDDYWEIINDLNASYPDGVLDYDDDDLTNLEEYNYDQDLNPWDPDTDNDGMPDGWEVGHQLDATHDDSHVDTDGDGLSNLDEYISETDPRSSDTDEDGMSDGWEVENGLDPLVRSDAKEDKDGDFLQNQLEYKLRKLGFRANSAGDVIISLLVVFTLLGLSIILVIKLRGNRVYARGLGYDTYPEYKKSIKAGFKSAKEQSKAISKGFMTKNVQDIIVASGHRDIWMMLESWKNNNSRITSIIDPKVLESAIESVDRSLSPGQLNDTNQDLDLKLQKLTEEEDLLNSQISLQEILVNSQKESNESLLKDINETELNQYLLQSESMMSDLEKFRYKINEAFEQKKNWFKPWTPLLSLIQITEDGMPISLERVAEVVQCPEDHAENLIESLLKENHLIGTYDSNKRIYTKGANIEDYVEFILSQFPFD